MITIDEAIKRLKNLAIHHHDDTFHEDEEAIKLGIEAMKEISRNRPIYLRGNSYLLPGETKEGD